MPATRSRTENWRHCLQSVFDKGGALEVSLPRYLDPAHPDYENPDANASLIWRVRILSLTETEIVIEQPSALGHSIHLQDGVALVGLVAIGQNRWMFRTSNLGRVQHVLTGGKTVGAYRLRMPGTVERCQRRNFYRISTVSLTLPRVEMYELLDAAGAAVAETASRCQILDLLDQPLTGCPVKPFEMAMPEVGPVACSTLVNIGGGGVGMLFEPGDQPHLDTSKLYWLRINLLPNIPAPLAVTARLRHTHIDSSQRLYAGVSFDFGHSPGHEKFIVDQLCRYVAQLQRDQLKRHPANE